MKSFFRFFRFFARKSQTTPFPTQEEIIQEEIDRAWEEHYEDGWRKTERAWLDERCPCGHRREDHYCEGGPCDVAYGKWHCECPLFGTPTEHYETFHEVNLGDSPGGFKIYE